MNADTILDIGHNAMDITLLVSAPMLLSGMIVGLVISVFQSVTPIQEITLTFVRIVDNMRLGPSEYRLKPREGQVSG